MNSFAIIFLAIISAEKGPSEWSAPTRLAAALGGIATAGAVAHTGYQLYRGQSGGLFHKPLSGQNVKGGKEDDDGGKYADDVPDRPGKKVEEADKAEADKDDGDDDGKSGKSSGTNKITWVVVVVVILAIGYLVSRQAS